MQSKNSFPFRITSSFQWGSCFRSLVVCAMFCISLVVPILLGIVLSVFRFTVPDYPLGIFKLFLKQERCQKLDFEKKKKRSVEITRKTANNYLYIAPEPIPRFLRGPCCSSFVFSFLFTRSIICICLYFTFLPHVKSASSLYFVGNCSKTEITLTPWQRVI